MWLNKAIINFNYNIKWSEVPNSINCTNGTSYLVGDVIKGLPKEFMKQLTFWFTTDNFILYKFLTT